MPQGNRSAQYRNERNVATQLERLMDAGVDLAWLHVDDVLDLMLVREQCIPGTGLARTTVDRWRSKKVDLERLARNHVPHALARLGGLQVLAAATSDSDRTESEGRGRFVPPTHPLTQIDVLLDGVRDSAVDLVIEELRLLERTWREHGLERHASVAKAFSTLLNDSANKGDIGELFARRMALGRPAPFEDTEPWLSLPETDVVYFRKDTRTLEAILHGGGGWPEAHAHRPDLVQEALLADTPGGAAAIAERACIFLAAGARHASTSQEAIEEQRWARRMLDVHGPRASENPFTFEGDPETDTSSGWTQAQWQVHLLRLAAHLPSHDPLLIPWPDRQTGGDRSSRIRALMSLSAEDVKALHQRYSTDPQLVDLVVNMDAERYSWSQPADAREAWISAIQDWQGPSANLTAAINTTVRNTKDLIGQIQVSIGRVDDEKAAELKAVAYDLIRTLDTQSE